MPSDDPRPVPPDSYWFRELELAFMGKEGNTFELGRLNQIYTLIRLMLLTPPPPPAPVAASLLRLHYQCGATAAAEAPLKCCPIHGEPCALVLPVESVAASLTPQLCDLFTAKVDEAKHEMMMCRARDDENGAAFHEGRMSAYSGALAETEAAIHASNRVAASLTEPDTYRVPRAAIMDYPPIRYEVHGVESDGSTVALCCVICRGIYPYHRPDCQDLHTRDYKWFHELLDAAERWKDRASKAEAKLAALTDTSADRLAFLEASISIELQRSTDLQQVIDDQADRLARVTALVAQWREAAKFLNVEMEDAAVVANVMQDCANELDAALAASAPTPETEPPA